MALPAFLTGPRWLFPGIVIVLLVPTVISHRTGKHNLNKFAFTVTGVVTAGMIASVALLIGAGSLAVGCFSLVYKHSSLRFVVLAAGCRRAARKGRARLARWTKVLMILKSLISLTILVLLAARAVNIL